MPGLAVAGLLQWQAGPAEQDTAPPGRGTLPAGAWVHLQRRVGGLGLTLLLCRRGHPALHSRRSRHSRRSGEEERAPPAPGARARSAGGTPWLGVRCRSLMSSPAPVPQAHTLLPVCRPYLLEDEGLHDCWVGDLHGTRHSHSIFTPLRGHSAQHAGKSGLARCRTERGDCTRRGTRAPHCSRARHGASRLWVLRPERNKPIK